MAAVLGHLGWDRAYILGHSWGGHLAFHLAHDLAPRLLGVLAVEPLGGIGDGGAAAFGAELLARRPKTRRAEPSRLDKDDAGEATAEEALEELGLVWPALLRGPRRRAADATVPATAPHRGASGPTSARASPRWRRPYRRSPSHGGPGGRPGRCRLTRPVSTARRIPGAWWMAVPDAGHFPWVEAPGCVLEGMRRLASGSVARRARP